MSALRELAIALGRTPTRDEFVKEIRGAKDKVALHFGSYAAFVHASGLDPVMPAKKITSAVFERDIVKHLNDYKPRKLAEIQPYKRCLFVPDTHFPFAHQKTLEAIYKFAEREKPEVVVQLGDLFDMYSHAKFPRTHNQFTPREEHKSARAQAEVFWSEIKKATPQSKCYQIVGNHDVRPLKRILEVYPEAEDWVQKMFADMMSFDGVETILDSRQELMLPGDVMVVHGYKSKIGEHRDHALYNAVCGHQHTGGVVYRQIRGRVLWELNAGLAGDPEAKGLTYGAQKINSWTLGFGFLDEYGPRFIPLR
jgi:predicted phosphodiesterase